MKIALLCRETKKLGGLEKYARHLTDAFKINKQSVTVLSHDKFKKRGIFSFQKLKNFDNDCQDWLKNHPQDVIFGLDRNSHQTHYRAGNGVHKSYLAKRQEGFLKSLSFSINPLHQAILELEKSCFESPRLIRLFTNSHMVKSEILEYYDVDEKKISVVHNGVEWDLFEKPFRQRKIKTTHHRLLFVGHGYDRKGLIPLLNALSLLKNEDWELTVIGKERSPQRFIKYALKLGLENRVHFKGAQSSVIPFYQDADILIVPSIYDPFANVTLEGLAMGLFVVSSKFNGGHEILNDSLGLTIPDLFDPESFANTLKEAMKKAPDKEKIRKTIQPYSFSNQLEKIVQETIHAS